MICVCFRASDSGAAAMAWENPPAATTSPLGRERAGWRRGEPPPHPARVGAVRTAARIEAATVTLEAVVLVMTACFAGVPGLLAEARGEVVGPGAILELRVVGMELEGAVEERL